MIAFYLDNSPAGHSLASKHTVEYVIVVCLFVCARDLCQADLELAGGMYHYGYSLARAPTRSYGGGKGGGGLQVRNGCSNEAKSRTRCSYKEQVLTTCVSPIL